MTNIEIVKSAYNAIADKKGEDITVIDISNVSVIADYFIIANGNNPNQVQAIAEAVEDDFAKNGVELKQREGHGNSTWILLDYGNIIVHVFSKEDRLFYDLERIWRDGKRVNIEEL